MKLKMLWLLIIISYTISFGSPIACVVLNEIYPLTIGIVFITIGTYSLLTKHGEKFE